MTSVELVNPWNDPLHTFRAVDVSQMYELKITPELLDFNYQVGISPTFEPRVIELINKTVSHELSVRINLPDFFVSLDSLTFVLARDSKKTVTFFFNENVVKERSKVSRELSSILTFDVEPLNVAGPVYVKIGV